MPEFVPYLTPGEGSYPARHHNIKVFYPRGIVEHESPESSRIASRYVSQMAEDVSRIVALAEQFGMGVEVTRAEGV